MSLRVRIAVAAGTAVALAVFAVAVSSYAGMRSQLLGQIDQSLKDRLGQVAPGGPGGGPGANRPRGDDGLGFFPTGGGTEGPGEGDEGLGLDRVPTSAFGATPGIFTIVYRDGSTYVPQGQKYPIPVDDRAKAVAASGHGQYFFDTTVRGTRLRVMVTGLPSNKGALMIGLPLTDVDHALPNQLLLLAIIAAAGIALAALFGLLVAKTALAPIARFTQQTERIAANPERIEHERVEMRGNDELARLGRTF